MYPHIDPNTPLAVIYNNVETFYPFLRRAVDDTPIHQRLYWGDRALLWLGDPKLAIVAAAPPHLDDLRERLGYTGTECLSPPTPSPFISQDVLDAPALMGRLADYAGPGRTLQLVPYATTPQLYRLAEALRQDYGLMVHLPESPAPENHWLRDHIDTKNGFRHLAARWLRGGDDLLPPGFVLHGRGAAASAAHWFARQGQACIIKADRGEGSIGQEVISPGSHTAPADIASLLEANPFLGSDAIVVERFIHSSARLSPSIEFFVPPAEAGPPAMTYFANQLFLPSGQFGGVLVAQELLEKDYYRVMHAAGARIAAGLQAMGYVGHFDLDAIIDDAGRVYLMEVNARRTGGTHAHEFARFFFGPDYLDRCVLLCQNNLSSGGITRYEALARRVDDLLYPAAGKVGVVITSTSTLPQGAFGCFIIAPTTPQALALEEELVRRIEAG